MNRTISTALLALALGFGTPALAQDSQLVAEADSILQEYGYEGVNADMFSTEQLAQFQTYFGAENEFENPAEARQRIDEILMMDAGTSTFVSAEMRAMFDDPTELEANARELLEQAGRTDVDVSGLTTEQLAQFWFLRERDEENNPAQLTDRIQAILDES
jgi:hypothetical protein